jgi:hypothetical protein
MRIGDRVHLLLVATTDVNPNEEFFFDYAYLVAAPNLAPDTLKLFAFGMAWPNLVVKTKSSEKIVYYPRRHFGHRNRRKTLRSD